MKQPVSFFYVEYQSGDLLGLLLAWACFVPPFIVAMQTAIFLTLWIQEKFHLHSTQVRLAGLVLLGQVANELFNVLLKNLIRQERPNTHQQIYEDFGMPSSHSQFMGFTAALFPHFSAKIIDHLQLSNAWFFKAFLASACLVGSLMVAYARIYLGYHSVNQVLVGLSVGFIAGTLWRERFISQLLIDSDYKQK